MSLWSSVFSRSFAMASVRFSVYAAFSASSVIFTCSSTWAWAAAAASAWAWVLNCSRLQMRTHRRHFYVYFHQNCQEIYWLQLFKCQDFWLWSVLYHLKLNNFGVFGLWVDQRHLNKCVKLAFFTIFSVYTQNHPIKQFLARWYHASNFCSFRTKQLSVQMNHCL